MATELHGLESKWLRGCATGRGYAAAGYLHDYSSFLNPWAKKIDTWPQPRPGTLRAEVSSIFRSHVTTYPHSRVVIIGSFGNDYGEGGDEPLLKIYVYLNIYSVY